MPWERNTEPSEEFTRQMMRYEEAMHAMQTGVAYVMEKNPSETSPKHLRVGVNSAMVEQSALARLLIAKGVITEEEYATALADGAEQEAAMYQRTVNQLYGDGRMKITLG